jgi:general secretion pathway protein H
MAQTASREEKGPMPTLAVGSKPGMAVATLRQIRQNRNGLRTPGSRSRQRGFTLMEIVIVAAIIGIASAVAVLSWPDSAVRTLEREGDRLAALLESARIHSRASGRALVWRPTEDGFVFEGQAPHFIEGLPTHWLAEGVSAHVAAPVVLGAEPLLPPQRITLLFSGHPQARVQVSSDGLQPFTTTPAP